MMRIFTIGLLLLCGVCSAQDTKFTREDKLNLRKANAYLKLGHPKLAEPYYRNLYHLDSSNKEIAFGYGRSLLASPEKRQKGIQVLNYVYDLGEREASFYLADAYLKTEQLDLAKQMVERYAKEGAFVNFNQVERLRLSINRAITAYDQPELTTVELLSGRVNSEYSEYMPLLTEDGTVMFYTSRRPGQVDGTNVFELAHEDIYVATSDSGNWNTSTKMDAPVNSETHDATVALLRNGRDMIMYRTHENKSGGTLLITSNDNGSWTEPTLFTDRINTSYTESSAWVSEDGNTIYFSSNRPGGFGGKDIYRIVRLPDSTWSLPLNLGANINTPYDEDGPFFHDPSMTLYFMSNGHETMGGFDLFMATRKEQNIWSGSSNMGRPINSTNNDIYLALDGGGEALYFSSDRPGGYGEQDIYKATLPSIESIQIVRARAYADSIPVSCRVTLIDEDSKKVEGIYNANPVNGRFIMLFKPGRHYQLVMEAEGYEPRIEHLTAQAIEEQIVEMEFELTK